MAFHYRKSNFSARTSGREVSLPAHGWRPRPHQVGLWRAMIGGQQRRHLQIAHRRWGKDDVALHATCWNAHRRVADYWHCLPFYAQARKAIWQAVNPHTGRRRIDEAFPRELRAATNETEMWILFKNGSRWRVVGSDNPDSLVGNAPAGIVFSEWALANPAAWAYLSPIVNENDGWATFITTPRGRNHAFRMYKMAKASPRWFADVCDVIKSGYDLAKVEEDRGEYRQTFGEEQADALIDQEFYCFPPGTPIWTDRGQRSIESIRLGDVVLTHAGRWRKVTRLYQHDHQGEMVEIHSAGSPCPLVCTPNHPVRICDPATQQYRWAPAGQVHAGQYVVMPRVKLLANPLIDEHLATLIGWFIAEGSAMKNAVQFSLGDEPHIAEKLRLAGERFGKVSVSPLAGQKGLAVRIGSAWLSDFLTMHCGSGADAKRIPWTLIAGHEEAVYEALIEGDGCRGDYGGARDVFTTISHSLALDVQMLAHMLGMRAGVYMRPKEKAAQHFQGRPITIRDGYSVRVSVIRKNGKYYGAHTRPQILPQKHGVAALVKKVERKPYTGPVHNFAVQFDESYVAAGRVVHNCSFDAAILGAYWGKLLTNALAEGRINPLVAPEPEFPIHRAWDLGIGDSTAIWFFQMLGREVRIVDFYEANGVGLDHYAKVIRKDKGIVGGDDFVPPDARARELGNAGKTRVETMIELGLNPTVVQAHSIEDGINAVRRVLPRCWFNEVTCEHGLERLRHYRQDWNEDNRVFSNKPLHDFSSHAADAFRYLALAYEEIAPPPPKKPEKMLQIDIGQEIPEGIILPTLDDLWALRDSAQDNPMSYN